MWMYHNTMANLWQGSHRSVHVNYLAFLSMFLANVPIDWSRHIKPRHNGPHAPTPSLCQVCLHSPHLPSVWLRRTHTHTHTHTQRLEQTDAWLIRHSSPGDSAGGERHSCRNVM